MLTDNGWREAGDLAVGDFLARPRKVGGFGDAEPVAPEHARLIGYLIGDGYVGGKTPIAFINSQGIATSRTWWGSQRPSVARRGLRGLSSYLSHRVGEQNGALALARWAGIWGHLAWEKTIACAVLRS